MSERWVLQVVAALSCVWAGCFSVTESRSHEDRVLSERRAVERGEGVVGYDGRARVGDGAVELAVLRQPVCATRVTQEVERTRVTVRTLTHRGSFDNSFLWTFGVIGTVGAAVLLPLAPTLSDKPFSSEGSDNALSPRKTAYTVGGICALGVPALAFAIANSVRARDSREKAGVVRRESVRPGGNCGPEPAPDTAVEVRFASGEVREVRTDAAGRARIDLGGLAGAAREHSSPWAMWSVVDDEKRRHHPIEITPEEHARLFRPDLAVAVAFDDSEQNGDGALSPGEQATVLVTLQNRGPGTARDVSLSARVEPATSGVTVEVPSAGEVAGRASAVVRLPVSAPPGAPPGSVRVVVEGRGGGRDLGPAAVEIPLVPWPPRLAVQATFDDSDGNGDLALNPGEQASLVITVTNRSPAVAPGVVVSARLAGPAAGVHLGPPRRFGLRPGENVTVRVPIDAAADAPAGEHRVLIAVEDRGARAPDAVEVTVVARPSAAQAAPAVEPAPAEGESIWVEEAGRPQAPLVRVTTTAANPRLLFGADRDGRLERSRDEGLSWEVLRQGLGGVMVTCVAIDPADPSIVMVGTRRHGVWRSTDGGGTFHAVHACLAKEGEAVEVIEIVALGRGRFAAATDSGVCVWADGAWTPISELQTGATWVGVTQDAVLAALANGVVARSEDGGATWQTSKMEQAGQSLTSAAADPQAPRHLLGVASGQALVRSQDGGRTWRPQPLLPALRGNEGVTLHALSFDPSRRGVAYLGTSAGILRSTDAGRTWRRFNYGVSEGKAVAVRAFAWSRGRLFASSEAPKKGLLSLGTVRRKVEFGAVHFAVGSNLLAPAAMRMLDAIAAQMLGRRSLTARIEGHTDSVGGPEANQRLSQLRAESVRVYLAMRGVPPAALRALGFGMTRPVTSNETPAGRTRNRRVEVYLIDQ